MAQFSALSSLGEYMVSWAAMSEELKTLSKVVKAHEKALKTLHSRMLSEVKIKNPRLNEALQAKEISKHPRYPEFIAIRKKYTTALNKHLKQAMAEDAASFVKHHNLRVR